VAALRPIVISDCGAVVSGHHRASEIGAAILRTGGNAFDAAIATSAALAIAIPNMSSLGGDCISLLFSAGTGRTTVVNGSGASSRNASVAALNERGIFEMPLRGPATVSVCGLVHAWGEVSRRFGSMELSELLAPSVALARLGTPIDDNLQGFFAGPTYADLCQQFPKLAILYGRPGARPIGSRIVNENLARTLQTICDGGPDILYCGTIAEQLVADLNEDGVLLDLEDFANHRTRIDEPIKSAYRGRILHTAPPNSQGVALAAMCRLAELDPGREKLNDLDFLKFLDRRRCAFHIRDAIAGDPDHVNFDPSVLSDNNLKIAQRQVRDKANINVGDTSTLVVFDRFGNGVSWVQSLFAPFGSGIVSPRTGIVMHNRLALQTLDVGNRFSLRPGHRPFHTLCPTLVQKGGACELVIATPGNHGQPQTLHQVMERFYVRQMTIQEAIEAPRVRNDSGSLVQVEDRISTEIRETLIEHGYEIAKVGEWSRMMGGVNAIHNLGNGLVGCGADPRRASYAVSAA
jgi:gamma-glutamyltranspeptidase/glutathione hydrolase